MLAAASLLGMEVRVAANVCAADGPTRPCRISDAALSLRVSVAGLSTAGRARLITTFPLASPSLANVNMCVTSRQCIRSYTSPTKTTALTFLMQRKSTTRVWLTHWPQHLLKLNVFMAFATCCLCKNVTSVYNSATKKWLLYCHWFWLIWCQIEILQHSNWSHTF